MSKLKFALLFVIMSAISIPAVASDAFVKRVPAGAVAFHFVFDLDLTPAVLGLGPPEFVGYIAFIEGVDGLPFAGPPSEDTAYFTVRVTRPLPPPVDLPVEPDLSLNVSVNESGGQFTVFYNANPVSRDWSVPDTFSQGVPIAVFDESALLGTAAFGLFPGVNYSVFSSKLIDSKPINFKGQRINFRRLVPHGVTVTNFGNDFRPNRLGASGGGTAIAIGERAKHGPYHHRSNHH